MSDRHIWAPEKRLYDSPGSATACEIEFIKGLGTHLDRDLAPVRTIRPIDRLWLLRGYLRSMERRADWGHIDQGKVRIAVLEAIAEEQNELAKRVATDGLYEPLDGHGRIGERQWARRVHRGSGWGPE